MRTLPTIDNLVRWNKVNNKIHKKTPSALNSFWMRWNKRQFLIKRLSKQYHR